MATFQFKDPQGNIHTAEGENMEEAFASLQVTRRSAAEEGAQQVRNQMFEALPWWKQAQLQVAQSLAETGEGVKRLFGREDPAADALLRMGKRHPFTPAGVAGYVGGEVLQTAVPASGMARALGALGKWAPAAADVGISAAQSALKAPVDQSRGEAAALGGVGAVLGRGAARLLSPGVRPLPAAENLARQGVRLTPGMAGGPVARTVENLSEFLPFVNAAAVREQERAVTDWGRMALNRVNPGPPVRNAGREGVEEVAENFNQAYRSLIGAVTIRRPDMDPVLAFARNRARTGVARLNPREYREFDGVLREMEHQMTSGGLTDRELKQWTTRLRNSRDRATAGGRNDLGLERAYQEILDDFQRMIASRTGNPAAYIDLDNQYAQFLSLRDASNTGSAAQRGGRFTPQDLIQVSASKARKGEPNLLSRELDEAAEIFGRNRDQRSVYRLLSGLGLASLGGYAAGGVPTAAATIPGLFAAGRLMGPMRGLAVQQPGEVRDLVDFALSTTVPSQVGGLFTERE